MSANTVTDNTVTVNTPVKKSFPAKYLKYLSYGLNIIKEIYPVDYQEKAMEYLHLNETVEFVMESIDNSLTDEMENEVKEIKRNNSKKRSRPKKEKQVSITEQIIELANEPTIVRGPVEEPATIAVEEPEVKAPKKRVSKPKAKKVAEVTEDKVEDKVEEEVATVATEVATEVLTEVVATEVATVAKKRVSKPKAKKVVEEVLTEVATVATEVVKEPEVVAEVAKVPKKRVYKPKAKNIEVATEVEVTNELEVEPEVAKLPDLAPWSLKAKTIEDAQFIKKCFGINVPAENIGRE